MFKKEYHRYTFFILLFLLISLVIAFSRGGSQAPEYFFKNLKTTDGKNLQFEGKNVILYFWAVWCTVCKVNDPFINVAYKTISDSKDTIFVSIEEGEATSIQLQEFLKSKNIRYPVISGNPVLLSNFGIQAYPEILFIDKNRNIKFRDTGILTPFSFWIRYFLL